jgi:hypothetical protein
MEDLSRGDEVVLTLVDKGILDEKGNLVEEEDELENVRSILTDKEMSSNGLLCAACMFLFGTMISFNSPFHAVFTSC